MFTAIISSYDTELDFGHVSIYPWFPPFWYSCLFCFFVCEIAIHVHPQYVYCWCGLVLTSSPSYGRRLIRLFDCQSPKTVNIFGWQTSIHIEPALGHFIKLTVLKNRGIGLKMCAKTFRPSGEQNSLLSTHQTMTALKSGGSSQLFHLHWGCGGQVLPSHCGHTEPLNWV